VEPTVVGSADPCPLGAAASFGRSNQATLRGGPTVVRHFAAARGVTNHADRDGARMRTL